MPHTITEEAFYDHASSWGMSRSAAATVLPRSPR